MPKSHVYAGRSPDHGSAHLYARGGLGILGALVPTTGDGGRGGLLANEVAANGWQDDELRIFIVSSNFPVLFVYDDSSWFAQSLTDGNFEAVQRVYRNGQVEGEAVLSAFVGASVPLSGTVNIDSLTLSGVFSPAQPGSMSGSAQIAPITLTGGFFGATLAPQSSVRPSFDVFTSVWAPVGDSSISSSLNEVSPSGADFATKDSRTPGAFVVAMADVMPPGRHLLKVGASVSTGVGSLSIRLLGADLSPVGVATVQAITPTSSVYILPIDTSAQATHLEVDGGQLRGTSQDEYQSDVVVTWVEVKTLAPYDSQAVADL